MPIYIGSYLADTARLTTEGHGAYLLLLMDYWRNGPLPDDDESLAAIARMPVARWSRYRAILGCLPFFSIRNGKWHQKRADAERDKATNLVAKRASAGSRGGSAKWGGESKAAAMRSVRLAEARALGTHTAEEWAALVEVCASLCVRCGADGRLFKDHIVPIYQGGSDSIENLQPLCPSCNSSKGPETSDHRGKDWRERLAKRLANASQDAEQMPGPLPSPSPSKKPNPNGLGKKPTKGTRIAADWTVGEQDREHAHQRGWGDQRIAAQALKFRDHWLASDDDRKARKRDWNAAWRTWCDNADKWDPEQPAGKRGRATEGERADALVASVAPELGDFGNVAGERGRSEERSRRGGDGAITVGYEVIPDADEPPICQPSTAAQGIAGDVAGVACEVPPGRSETGLGSRSKNPQMGDPAEDRANGGSGGIGPVVSAQAESQSNIGQSHHAAGMGQAGSDADYFAIPKFLQQ